MTRTITAVFDGETLRPDSPLGLERDKRYLITIAAQEETEETETGGNAWSVLTAITGTIEAPEDWSLEHDHYLYGTPKQYSETLHEL
ncbi:MAG: hypothetical protein GXP42_10495 [Chloroflexi bacterium]|nr:hypothetical protein [Chloroflexota bacterium]